MLKTPTKKDVLKEILNQKASYSSKFLTVKHKKEGCLKAKSFLIVSSAVSKKAVDRNKLKRRARAILKESRLPKLVSTAVFFKKGSGELKFGELKEKLLEAVKNIK